MPDCPCERFQPGENLQAILRRTLALVAALALSCSPGLARLTHAAEPPAIPASFAEVAATARAASVVIRASTADAIAADVLSVPAAVEADEDVQEDGWAAIDSVAARRNRTVGAGVIIDPRGIALTSARAVLRAPAFELVLIDGTPLEATVVGLDLRSDVAVLRLENGAGFFPHLPLGDSERVRVGDWVISVGAPLGLEGTVAAGIITATPTAASPNPLASYLQSDTATARGNVGGPLVNLNGEVVGLGTVLYDDGVAYAIPSKILRRVTLDLLEKGRVSRPWLGTTTQSLNAALARALGAPDDAGVLIADVLPEGPGAGAGLRPGDIVLELGTTPISSRLQFERAISALDPGDVVKLTLRRESHVLRVSVRLSEEPDAASLPPARALAKRRLGIDVRPVNPTTGAVARDVDLWSSAARAGIRSGDVIREINHQPIRSVADFQAVARTLRPRAPVLMRVQRGDVVLYVVVTGRE